MKGVIFDLDGVILSTDNFHYMAWKKMADEEGIEFNRLINERLRGVSRMASLEIILEKAEKKYTQNEKDALAERKNNYYRKYLEDLKPEDLFPGALEMIKFLKGNGYKVSIGSSSKNTKTILKKAEITGLFDAVSDGTNISKSKPDPEVFLKAAEWMGCRPSDCFVIEDAGAGIEAGNRGGMVTIGVGAAKDNPNATHSAEDIRAINKDLFPPV